MYWQQQLFLSCSRLLLTFKVSIDVRGVLITALALVHGNDGVGVKWKLAVRVDGHAEQARICLNAHTRGRAQLRKWMSENKV